MGQRWTVFAATYEKNDQTFFLFISVIERIRSVLIQRATPFRKNI